MNAYEFETQAAKGEEMPDGLTPVDQHTYQAMRFLYALYRTKRIDINKAAQEKKKLLRSYRQAKAAEDFQIRRERKQAQMWKSIEETASRYQKERTLENADAFVKAVYGFI